MATTSSVGGSGFDVNAIVSQLMTVERQPITKLNKQEASYQAKLSAYGTVKSAVDSFQTALQSLKSSGSFQAYKATPADTSILAASASSSAVAGNYSLEITSLAQSQQLVAAGQTSSTAAIGSGAATTVTFDFGTIAGNTFDATTGKYGTTLTGASTTTGSSIVTVPSTANLAVGAAISGTGIPVGATIASITDATHFVISANATATGTANLQANATFTSNGSGAKSITIDSTNNTLEGIRDAINAANIGVSATIVNDGSGTPYRLALASTASGASNSLSISVAGDAAVSNLLSNDPTGTQNLSETVTAKNANLKVNGISITKSSNTITDAIQGVTLNLSKLTTGPTTLTVAKDTTAINSAAESFVKAYNDLTSTLKSVSAYNPTTKTGAVLQGDSSIRQMLSQLRGIMGTAVTGGAYSMLSEVGITTKAGGSLSLDSTKFQAAIASNLSDVSNLFTSAGGYATMLDQWATTALDTTITSRTDGINKSIKNIGNQILTLEARMTSIERRYRTQFSSLDTLLTSMNSTSSYLTQQLARL